MQRFFETSLHWILGPLKVLPLGYYRLVLALWLCVPIAASVFMYYTILILGHKNINDDAAELAFAFFSMFLIIYYPLIRLLIWVWKGFQEQRDIELSSAAIFRRNIEIRSEESSVLIPIETLWKNNCFTALTKLRIKDNQPFLTFLLDKTYCHVAFDKADVEFILNNYKEGDDLVKSELLKLSFIEIKFDCAEDASIIKGILDKKICINKNNTVFQLAKHQKAFCDASSRAFIFNLFKQEFKYVPVDLK
ncbi:MAG TPA: hypothetical protein VK174_11690 [Chitinophagales bacterium]|nr:hypothetical protein [Chitinophagales bacterium]